MSENKEGLTAQQHQVLTLISQGSTVSAAADAAGVHRNTVANWHRTGSYEFRKCWEDAQLEQTAFWRDRVQALGDLAIQALQQILEDPKTSPSIRYKAATTVLNAFASPPAAKSAQSAQPREETSESDRTVNRMAPACAPKNTAQSAQRDLDQMILKQVASHRKPAACAPQNLAQTCTTTSGIHALASTP